MKRIYSVISSLTFTLLTLCDEIYAVMKKHRLITAAATTLVKPTFTVTTGDKSATIRWNKVNGATRYLVYFDPCNKDFGKAVKTVKSTETLS